MTIHRLLPLLIALAAAVFMVFARLLTNYCCKKRGKDMVAAGTTSGFIPGWISLLYLLGLSALAVSCVWSFIATGWWAALLVIALYFLTGLVHSRATDINLLIRFNTRDKI